MALFWSASRLSPAHDDGGRLWGHVQQFDRRTGAGPTTTAGQDRCSAAARPVPKQQQPPPQTCKSGAGRKALWWTRQNTSTPYTLKKEKKKREIIIMRKLYGNQTNDFIECKGRHLLLWWWWYKGRLEENSLQIYVLRTIGWWEELQRAA